MAMSSGSSSTMMRNTYSSPMATGAQSGQSIQSSGNEPSQQAQPTQRNANTAFLCKAGCETVQEIVVRTSEVFAMLKTMPLPSGTSQGNQLSLEKKLRIQEYLNSIQRQFKTLRAIYTRVNDDCAGMEYTHIESLIPYKDEGDNRTDQKKISDNYRHLVEEARDLREQLYQKARYMKEIIEQLRKIIWEVNTMLAMSNT
ncbi:mediator of RNA polymerase II transcription subunit 30-like [Macrobrachium nipponense]|uniref:mediator of RNA polymerase II transcription subunit 30-like n=1 Tax=Macrobrachium nipponense TaxID=159736 RepID=UPI0030C87225